MCILAGCCQAQLWLYNDCSYGSMQSAMKHAQWPHPTSPWHPCPQQERYREYRRCMAEQQLSPVRLRDFFKHSDERGVPAL